MSMLSAPLHYIKASRSRAKQKRNALHMMALSGVIRPSHIELRYGIPLTSLDASCPQSTTMETPLLTERTPVSVWLHDIRVGVQWIWQIWQWMRTTSHTMMQSNRKPIGFQLDID